MMVIAASPSLILLPGFFLGAFYHLASATHPCNVMSSENASVDILCEYHDVPRGGGGGASMPCSVRTITWQKVDTDVATNVTDSAKYGVWEAIPGWGLEEGKHLSLLRVRDVQPEDVGRYQCRILCQGQDGTVRQEYHTAELCLQQPNSKYAICGAQVSGNECTWTFWDGDCDPDCDKEETLFDGFDCDTESTECPADVDGDCREIFANGVCDRECDSAGCAWDGGDCIDKPLNFADGTVVLTLARWYKLAGKTIDVKHLGRTLSALLHTVVRVLPESWHGEHMRTSTGDGSTEAIWHRPDKRGYNAVRKIFLKLDNTMCRRRCFTQASAAARYIARALRSGYDPGIPISAIGVLGRSTNRCTLENNTLLHIDLPPSGSTDENSYSYSHARRGETQQGPPLWVMITAVVGGALTLILICVIIFIVHRIRKLSKEERRQANSNIIQMDKNGPPGTDV